MSIPEPIPESLAYQLRRLTTAVPQNELVEYIYYDHIPILKEASHRLGLFVLVRRTNPESIKFVGWPGFVPKPLACKPKTAKTNAQVTLTSGKRIKSSCAGLVVDPRVVGASAFGGSDAGLQSAVSTWKKYWGGGVPGGFDLQKDPDSGYYGCVMRSGKGTRVFPHMRSGSGSVRTETLSQPGIKGFQLLPDMKIDFHALSTLPVGCSYIHGDYDLYALVHLDNLTERVPRGGKFDGETHSYGANWKAFEALVRSRISLDMIQHGSQEHFTDHTDDTVDMFCPTVDRALWHVKIEGAKALDQLYVNAFQGRTTKHH